MGDFPDDDTVFRAFNDRKLNADSHATGYGPAALLAIAGLYTVFKALDFLGYPVWLWLHMGVERIARSQLLGGSSADAAQDDTQDMQSGGGILSRTLQKGVRGVAGALSKVSSDVPPGLGNWDNSCYQNSVIQGLASLPSLREYLAKASPEHGSVDTETTNGALFDMITKLNDPSNHGQNFWIRGKLKSMSTFQQQDAQEYYSKILDALDKEARHEATKRRSSDAWADAAKTAAQSLKGLSDALSAEDKPKPTPNPLDGLLAQRVGCTKCGYVEGLQMIPFNCVTVSLGRNYTYDIRECLDDYTTLEHIDGVECAKCTLLKNRAALAPLAERSPAFAERLQAVEDALENDDFDDKTLVKEFKILKKNWTQSTKSRQAVIARAPKALVLHVNRSIFDEMTGAQYKNTASVSYPRVLDLGNWCLGSDVAGGEWPRDPNRSMLGDAGADPLTSSPFQYRLRAAVTHYGSHGNGHYVCYRPHGARRSEDEDDDAAGDQWWRFSDDSVYAISEQQAHQGNIFMLFYERIDGDGLVGEQEEEEAQVVASREEIPLPPSELGLPQAADDTAAAIPLPVDDDDLNADEISDEKSLPALGTLPAEYTVTEPAPTVKDDGTSAYPTPPPESPSAATFDDTEMSEAGSEDAPSTQLTSDDEADVATTTLQVKTAQSPHLMRTAGDKGSRDGGSRASLPMVTAT